VAGILVAGTDAGILVAITVSLTTVILSPCYASGKPKLHCRVLWWTSHSMRVERFGFQPNPVMNMQL
jgi:hypothetical protein